MSLANVNINRQDGGLFRQSESKDGISALVVYSASLSGYAGNYKFFSEQDAKDLLTGSTESEEVIKYHVAEYYNRSVESLYVKIVGASTSTFDDVVTLKDFAEGEPRQYGVLDLEDNYSSGRLNLLQGQADKLEAEKAPGQIVYSADISGTVESLASLQAESAPRVSFVISEDLSDESKAKELRDNGASFVGSIGAVLGAVSSVKVSTSIAYVEEVNLASFGYSNPGFIDGSLLKDKSSVLLDTLDTYHYIFVRKFVDLGGSYFNFAYTAVNDAQSDFNTIDLNRTYDKAYRALRVALLKKVCAPALVDSNGNLNFGFVKNLESLAGKQLQFMKNAEEISDFVVSIDPTQKVLETSTINVVAKIIPVGTAKEIDVKLGFSTKL